MARYHIEAEAKWTPFHRQHFQMYFLEWKCMNFAYDFTEVCSWCINQQYTSIGSDNGLAPTRRQAIIWTNDGWFTDAYMRHSASMSYSSAQRYGEVHMSDRSVVANQELLLHWRSKKETWLALYWSWFCEYIWINHMDSCSTIIVACRVCVIDVREDNDSNV